jgi:regulator of replication initiation timing
MDAEEDAWLNRLPPVPSVAEVQGRRDKTLAEIAIVSRNIGQVRRENEALRQEKEALCKQLIEQTSDAQKAACDSKHYDYHRNTC